MSAKTLRFALCALILGSACGDEEDTEPGGPSNIPGPDAGNVLQGQSDAGSSTPDGAAPQLDGSTTPNPTLDGSAPQSDGSATLPVDSDAGGAIPAGDCDYKDQEVSLTSDLVIAAGSIVRVCEGVTFTAASAQIKVQVDGTLSVKGTADKPVKFTAPSPAPDKWAGIVVGATGDLRLERAQISGAHFGVRALAGSYFAIDYAEFSQSFKGAVIESNGKVDHSKFLGADIPGFKLTDGVEPDDLNGTFTVIGSSPNITNSLFVGSPSKVIDVVRIGTGAAPTFDHVLVRAAHCGFHTSETPNETPANPRITNSIIEDNTYGVMAYNGKATFENCVFRRNSNDFGFCFNTNAGNAPVLMSNYYPAGAPSIETISLCPGLVKEPTPATSEPAGVGPVGL